MTDDMTPRERYVKYIEDIAHAGMAVNMVGLDSAMHANKMVKDLASDDREAMTDILVFNEIAEILKKPAVELTMAMVKLRKLLDKYLEEDDDEAPEEEEKDDDDNIDDFLKKLREDLLSRL